MGIRILIQLFSKIYLTGHLRCVCEVGGEGGLHVCTPPRLPQVYIPTLHTPRFYSNVAIHNYGFFRCSVREGRVLENSIRVNVSVFRGCNNINVYIYIVTDSEMNLRK